MGDDLRALVAGDLFLRIAAEAGHLCKVVEFLSIDGKSVEFVFRILPDSNGGEFECRGAHRV